MATLIENGYKIFTDKEGNPIEEGYIFIGEAGLNPITNPQQAYWDSALTIPATNIRTDGGYPVYNGSPSRLYVADNYSILVQNKQLQTVYVQLDAEGYVDTPSTVPGFDRTYVEVKSAATITVKAGSYADVNGTSIEILTDTDLSLAAADTDYYIRLTSAGVLSLITSAGTFDVDQNARYLSGDRILKWVARRDATEVTLKTMYDTYNNSKVFPMEQSVNPTDSPEFVSMVKYDYIVDSDAKLDALADMTSGSLTAILVKEGDWTLAATKTITLDAVGCKKFICETGATITGGDTAVGLVINSTLPTTNTTEYFVFGITTTTGGSYTLKNLINVSNCTVSGGRFDHCYKIDRCLSLAFYYCEDIINSTASSEFFTCVNLVNCLAQNSGYNYCLRLSNCKYEKASTAGSGSSYQSPFLSCSFLTNCLVVYSSAGQEIRAYHTCGWCSNCSAIIGAGPTASSAIFYNSGFVYAPDITNKGAATAFSGSTGVNTNASL